MIQWLHSFESIGASSLVAGYASISLISLCAIVLLLAATTLLDIMSNGPPENVKKVKLIF